jgi:hypothetical protein
LVYEGNLRAAKISQSPIAGILGGKKENGGAIRENHNYPVHAEINQGLFSYSVILVVNALNCGGF